MFLVTRRKVVSEHEGGTATFAATQRHDVTEQVQGGIPVTDVDDWSDPEDYEAAQLRAEEPPDWYLEEEGHRAYERHRRDEHFGEECNYPPYEPPLCRVLYRVPRWTPRHGWRCGTPGGCNTLGHRSPWAARRDHRLSHEAPF